MHNHWTEGIKVKDLLLCHRPKLLVELGAGAGDNTRLLLQLQAEEGIPNTLVVISDNAPPTDLKKLVIAPYAEDFDWIEAVSYKQLTSFRDASIDCAIIDTDHNGWTLMKELAQLERTMTHGGLLLIHDTESFTEANGFAQRYCNNEDYPQEMFTFPLTYGDVFAQAYSSPRWHLITQSAEHSGAAALLHIRLQGQTTCQT